MSKQPKRNPSARDKQLARERARRAARQVQDYPLYELLPPFQVYEDWTTVTEAAMARNGYPPQATTEESRRMWDVLIKLGPLYKFQVPRAAIYLEMQIQEGFVLLAVDGEPDRVNQVPLAELAPDNSAPDAAETAAKALHDLHFGAAMVMDDNQLMHRASPPAKRGGQWFLSGCGDVSV
jgi:hypothetical protein